MKVVLAEKPSVARDIARVLNANQKKEGYYYGNSYCITWAFGHLIGLSDPDSYDKKYQKWHLDDLPLIPESFKTQVINNKGTKKQFACIESLFNHPDCEEVICATDAGREGELIFRLIYEKAKCKKPIKRLWISSQTDEAIKEGFAALRDGEDYQPLFDSARSRSEADWLIGINATRAYSIKLGRGNGVMSVGRVQTPVLKMIVDRYKENIHFVPKDYFELQADIQHAKGDFKGIYFDEKKNSRFDEKEKALEIQKTIEANPEGVIEKVSKKKKSEAPPLLYDLTSLQKDAYRQFKFPAEKTLSLLQSLYERHKVLSYPRTSSRYLSKDLEKKLPSRLAQLQQIPELCSFVQPLINAPLPINSRIVNDKKVTDHHAIIPTEKACNPNSLSADEQKIYMTVIKRFVAVFHPACQKESTEIITNLSSHLFKSQGVVIKVAGWRALYQDDENTQDEKQELLPAVKKADPIKALNLEVLAKKTKAPPLYNEASILSAMETAGKHIDDEELAQAMKDCGLGTPATRAQILERLVSVKYIKKEKNTLIPTEKGIFLVDNLQSPEMLSPELTGQWEKKLNDMANKTVLREEFMKQIKDFTHQIIDKNKQLKDLVFSSPAQSAAANCPLCQKGKIQKGPYGFYCNLYRSGCSFKLPLKLAGKALTEDLVNLLITDGKTGPLKGFRKKDGGRFEASLLLNERQQVLFKLCAPSAKVGASSPTKTKKASLPCPMCQKSLRHDDSHISCSACSFTLQKCLAYKTLSDKETESLIKKKKTKLIDGFKSKSGKSFKAYLLLSDEGKVLFKLAAS